MVVELLTEHHLEFLSLKGGCRGLSESSLVKMSNCWKSHFTAQMNLTLNKSSRSMSILGVVTDMVIMKISFLRYIY